MKFERYFEDCRLCPRQCRANRLDGHAGFCGETAQLRVATIEAHFGEEPPISGTCGSGTVFFSGCTLKCDFCQNYQISTQGLGKPHTVSEVVQSLVELQHTQGIHNVNFVTPDHFFPHCWHIVQELRERNIPIPAVYNLSGYASIDMLRVTEPFADIYLPDFKYADRQLARQLSSCENYPSIALDALTEMVRQKGFLDASTEGEIAQKGVLVRHLILPGQVQNSLDALSMQFLEFGRDLPLSLMSQYHPIQPCSLPEMDRRITLDEFQQVYDHALSLGFEHLFVQYPEAPEDQPVFLPDFTQTQPFEGNRL
jgi:putative pyruvate formate lyase activating enzyme